MSPQYPPGSEGWRDAQDYLPPAQAEIAAERFKEFQARAKAVLDRRRKDGVGKPPSAEEEKAEAERLAKERAEFKEMMEA